MQANSNPIPLNDESDGKRRFKRSWYAVSFLTQTRWLLWREYLNVIRNPVGTYILLGQAAVTYFLRLHSQSIISSLRVCYLSLLVYFSV